MIEQILDEIEAAKASLQEWQRRGREAAQATQQVRGYLDGLARALELVQTAGQKEDASSEPMASGEVK